MENAPWRKEFFNILLITVLESYMSRYREISELPGSIHPNCNSDLLLVTGGYLSTASTTFRSLLCPTIWPVPSFSWGPNMHGMTG